MNPDTIVCMCRNAPTDLDPDPLCKQLYLLKDSARRLDLTFPEAEQMVASLNAVKNKEHKGTIPTVFPENNELRQC
jgi:hypothetical protein